MERKYDWFMVFVVIGILLIPLYFLAPGTLLFRPFAGEFTIYGGVISLVLLVGFLSWIGFFRWWIKREIGRKQFLRQLGDTLARLGFRRSWLQVAIGLVVGVCMGIATWYFGGSSPSSALGLTGWIVSMGVITVFLAPLIEETLFRGYLINRCVSSDKGKTWAWALAIAASIFVFSWSHARNPELRVVAGAVFTLMYLWGRGNNMTAAVMTHAGNNAAILLSAFLPLWTIESTVALVTVVVTIPFLVLIIWAFSPRKPRQSAASRCGHGRRGGRGI